MRSRWIALLGLATTLVLAAAVALATSEAADATFSGSNGSIAFFSDRTTAENPEGDWEIFTTNPDGSNVTQLTHNEALDWEPAVSPGGRRIAFFSDRDGNNEIYVMNADGTGQTRLTDNWDNDHYPVFSSDGSMIYFVSERDGNSEIYAMNADGSGTATNLTDNPSFDGNPAVSPDGTKIAFTSWRDGPGEIYVMNSDGSNPTRLTYDALFADYLNYSPNGTKITFHSARDGDYDIYTVNADGSNLTNLTDDSSATETHPAPSPDGKKIAFESTRDGNQELYTMDWDGSNLTRLTTNPTSDAGPDWQPFNDTTPPKVSETYPSNNATGVPATADITATLLEEGSGIDPDTITTDTFKVVQVKPTGNVRVSGDVTYKETETSKKATFDPTSSLAKGLYRATLTTDVADKAGNHLSKNFTWTFTTAGPPARR